MAVGLAEHLQKKGETARTVTTKVRYPDFAIRSRSTSLPVGTDDADRISELACKLLDRALDDRPGALRLVGVGSRASSPIANSHWSNVTDVKKHLGTALTTVAMIAGLALLGFLAWSWWQSRLPGSYDVMSYGAVDDGGAQPIAHDHFGVASLTGPKGKPNYKVTLTAETGAGAALLRPGGERLDVQRQCARPRASHPSGRPRPGHARQQGHRRRRDDPLARPRRPECRRRRRRSHPERRRAGRPLRLPLPPGAGRDVLVPHASGRLARREAGALRRPRHRLRSSALAVSTSPSRCTRSRVARRSAPTTTSGARRCNRARPFVCG